MIAHMVRSNLSNELGGVRRDVKVVGRTHGSGVALQVVEGEVIEVDIVLLDRRFNRLLLVGQVLLVHHLDEGHV